MNASGQELAPAVDCQAPPILIADHDTASRALMAQGLVRAGHAVETLAGGEELLARLRRRRYGLAFIDAGSIGSGGIEVLKSVKQSHPGLAVVVMTADGSVSEAVAALHAGASDYLLKPFPAETLVSTVRRFLQEPGSPGGEARPQGKEFLTRDAGMLAVLDMARQVAGTPATVLIQGESGTGKELLAAYIHRHSANPQAPYVAVNCAALPETLAESELFGHEKGAFTGAFSRKIGKFELARRGTLVLDEIGEMPVALQAKLLRTLQEKEIDRVGGGQPVPVEARVIAITHRDLARCVAEGRFREDLYYRIHVMPLTIPPLRERPADILWLAEHFRESGCARLGKSVQGFTKPAVEALERHGWKGNVRELENAVERALILAQGEWIEPRHLGLAPSATEPGDRAPARGVPVGTTVWEMERRLIMDTLSDLDQNRTRAAEMLGISIRTLRNKLREYKSGAGTAAA